MTSSLGSWHLVLGLHLLRASDRAIPLWGQVRCLWDVLVAQGPRWWATFVGDLVVEIWQAVKYREANQYKGEGNSDTAHMSTCGKSHGLVITYVYSVDSVCLRMYLHETTWRYNLYHGIHPTVRSLQDYDIASHWACATGKSGDVVNEDMESQHGLSFLALHGRLSGEWTTPWSQRPSLGVLEAFAALYILLISVRFIYTSLYSLCLESGASWRVSDAISVLWLLSRQVSPGEGCWQKTNHPNGTQKVWASPLPRKLVDLGTPKWALSQTGSQKKQRHKYD